AVDALPAKSNSGSGDLLHGQLVLLVALPQELLVELADARLRNLGHNRPALGQPPARDPLSEVRAQIVERQLGLVTRHYAGERPPLPALVRNPDDTRLEHVRVPHQRVLEVDGGNPLPARLDHVLESVGDLYVAVRVDRADVAGAQPAVAEALRRGVL